MSRIAAHLDVFHAVADPTRRAILDRLRSGQAPVTDLATGFRMSRPAVSKHLRVLRQAKLVREHREGRQRIYQLTPGPLRDVATWVEEYRTFWQTSLLSLKHHLERKHP
jgi:DNA-binding transcriptional ArsR family regulator